MSLKEMPQQGASLEDCGRVMDMWVKALHSTVQLLLPSLFTQGHCSHYADGNTEAQSFYPLLSSLAWQWDSSP